MKTRANNPESGYVLLMIFVMAAILAISLYRQVPRVAFEAQRDKEQLLIDRGNQYTRAVTLFVHKFNRFPTSMDELENTNNMRFLRRRYVDPMTGKADWRILHAGPGGVILDSVTTKKSTASTLQNTNVMTMLTLPTDAAPSDAGGVNVGLRVRPSDQAGAPGSGSGSDPGSSGSSPGMAPNNGPVMVLPDGRIVPANITGALSATGQAGLNPVSGLGVAGTGLAGAGGTLPTGVAVQQNGQNTPPLPPQIGGPPGSAANLINQILTTPRPGGLNGLQGGQGVTAQGTPLSPTLGATMAGSASTAQQQVIGAGLAGVASKREQEGIKTYNSRTKYNEWEFVFDITKDPKLGRGAAGAAGGTGGQGAGPRPGQPGPGMAGPAMTSPTSAPTQ